MLIAVQTSAFEVLPMSLRLCVSTRFVFFLGETPLLLTHFSINFLMLRVFQI